MKYWLFFTFILYFLLLQPQKAISQEVYDDMLTHEIPVPSGGSWQAAIKASDVSPVPNIFEITPKVYIPPLGIEALPLGISIEGINFNQDAINTTYYHIPPDPIGVAGPNHLISVVNTSIEWYSKSGVNQNSQSLASFFSSVSPLTGTFDPKVIYDQYANRFVVVALERVEAGSNPNPDNISRILLAVSDDSDPNGTWYFHAINAKIVISSLEYWADYPGFALDEEAVYVTANMFAFYPYGSLGGIRLWIIDKGLGSGGFYDGGTASVTINDPYAGAGIETTTQPTHIFGTNLSSTVGTFLVSYSGLNDGVNEYLQIVRVDNPLGTPSFYQQYIFLGDIESNVLGMPDAPQNGTSFLIETNDRRALHAVWRDSSLWTTAQIVPSSGVEAGQATAHWWKLNTTNLNSISVDDQGNVGGEDIATGTYTFFPSIAVDSMGNMAIGFSASAPTIYPGAYYTGRLSTDPPGTVQPSEILRAGLDYYIRTFGTPGVDRNRWGDYSGMSVDPSDEITFWVFNEYALTRGTILPQFPTEDGRWGTAFGSYAFTISANIRAFLQGPFSVDTMATTLRDSGNVSLSHPYNIPPWNYNGTESVTSIPPDVVDWVLVELRTGTDASTIVKTRAAFIKKDGIIVDLDGNSQVKFTSIVPDDYYIVIHHRNHLSIMSATAHNMSYSSTLFDFSADLNNAFGSNSMVNLGGGIFGMWGGDADGSGTIDNVDRTTVWTDRNQIGYYNSDCTFSRTVDANDRGLVWNNRDKTTNVP